MNTKNFAPSWFASVMGTGGLALVSNAYSKYLLVLKNFGIFLTYLNTVLFFVLLIPWIHRWIRFREDATRDLYHPMISHFYGTIAIGLLVLSADYLLILKSFIISFYLWIAGTILTILFSFLIPYLMFIQKDIDLKNVTPAWFIPPVGLIVIPLSGGFFINYFDGMIREILVFINYFAWSSGFFLYLALFSVVMYRLITHEPMPCGMAPSIWINLGPIGVGTSTLIILVKNSYFISTKDMFFGIAMILWGFGVWWFFMAVIMTIHYIKNLNLPYSLAWWAFIFPLAAYVSGTHSVANAFQLAFVDYFGFSLYFFLLTLWLITSIKTIIHLTGRK